MTITAKPHCWFVFVRCPFNSLKCCFAFNLVGIRLYHQQNYLKFIDFISLFNDLSCYFIIIFIGQFIGSLFTFTDLSFALGEVLLVTKGSIDYTYLWKTFYSRYSSSASFNFWLCSVISAHSCSSLFDFEKDCFQTSYPLIQSCLFCY